jgi:hypothetical protein
MMVETTAFYMAD